MAQTNGLEVKYFDAFGHYLQFGHSRPKALLVKFTRHVKGIHQHS